MAAREAPIKQAVAWIDERLQGLAEQGPRP